jgi:hypothetical protein
MSDSGRDWGASSDEAIKERNAQKAIQKNLGSLFFALAELTNAKGKSRIISECFQAAINAAMEKKEGEVAAMIATLRRQLIDVPNATPIQEIASSVPFQQIKRGVYQLPDGSMVAVD